jgi:hypothetical protein
MIRSSSISGTSFNSETNEVIVRALPEKSKAGDKKIKEIMNKYPYTTLADTVCHLNLPFSLPVNIYGVKLCHSLV